MQLYVTNPRISSGENSFVALSAVTLICALLLTSCARASSQPDGGISPLAYPAAADGNAVGGSGPTILIGYTKDDLKLNPISSFMYFVPLISPTFVDRETSARNEQQTGVISYESDVTSNSFHVTCEFAIWGKGFHQTTFDLAGTIAANAEAIGKKNALANVLDYIRLEGDGVGRIEVKGTIDGTTQTVTEVDLQFNARGHRSPVTVGIYDIKKKNGTYAYENRSNQVVARVNSLVFKRTEKTPHMGIKVASITGATKSEGLLSNIRGSISNLFITPPIVTKLGNDTMLSFGYTLLKKEPSFTFPKATNIRKDGTAVAEADAPQGK
jgi:hypothetical protein